MEIPENSTPVCPLCGRHLKQATVRTATLGGVSTIPGQWSCPRICPTPRGAAAWDASDSTRVVHWPTGQDNGLGKMLAGQLAAGWSPAADATLGDDGRTLVYVMARTGFQGLRG